jgi:hypothetical protein
MSIPPGSLQRLYDISDPACYSGSGNTVVNTAQAAYNLQRVNGPTFVSDGQKSHFVFNRASQQYLGLGNNSTSIGGPYNTMTINVWFQSTDTSTSTLFSFGYNSPSGVQPTIFLNDASAGYASASFNYGVGITFTTTPYINDTWNMITMVSDGTNNKIYLNGVLQSSAAQGGGTWPANGGSYIGALGDAAGNAWSTAPFFNGKVAYLAQYDAALSTGDILTIYNNTKSRFSPTPTVEYDFQNGSYPGSGSTITDLQGGDTNLTVGNGHWVSGTPNYFDLQGDTNLFNTNPGSAFSSTTFTVNCWYNPLYTNPGTYASVWGLGKDGNPTSPILSTNSDGTLNIQWSFGYGIVSTTVTNDWHLISFVSNGSTTTLYVDGISIGSNASSSGTVASPYTIRLGSSSSSSNAPISYAYGKIGYWSYFDVALDAADILAIYNATSGSYAPPPAPIAQYDFQNGSYPGSGTSVLDLSGTGNTLAITSGGTWVSGTPNYFDLAGDTAIYKSPAIGGIASTNVYTLNGWYYLPTSVNNSVIFEVGEDTANAAAQIGSGFGLGTLYGTGGFGLGVIEFTGATQPGWNFVSYVSTGSSTTAYLNGASVGSTTNVPSLPSDAGIIIGTALNNASPPVPRLDLAAVGRVGYFDVYNVALGSTEITDIYNATVSSYPSPPPSSNGVGGRQFAQGFNG